MPTILNQWETGPFNGGVNLSMLPELIAENEACVIQDMLLDSEGELYARGPIANVVHTGTSTFNGTSKKIKSLFSTVTPSGVTALASISQSSNAAGLFFTSLAADGGATVASLSIDGAFPQTSDCVVDVKPALNGGVWIGTQELPATSGSINSATRQCLLHWRGAIGSPYSTGTVTCNQGSTAVTGVGTSWASTIDPGTFLLNPAGTALIGVVKQVNSNTSITLEANANWSLAAAAYLLNPIRSFGLEIAKGRIAAVAASAGPPPVTASTSIIGSGTKFQAMGIDNTWTIFRSRDNVVVGVPTSVQGDEGLILTAGAAVSLDNEPYVARRQTVNTYTTYLLADANPQFKPGVLNATFAGVQWFARQDLPQHVGNGEGNSRIWASDFRNPEAIDMQTIDGDFEQITSTVDLNTPIRGIASTASALLIFKDAETFALTGTSPADFNVTKIWDDGCLSPSSIQTYKGSVCWAGRDGIYHFDGKQIVNLVDRSLGKKWKTALTHFDPRLHKITGSIYQEHYAFTINSNDGSNPPNIYNVIKGSTVLVNFGLTSGIVHIPRKALVFLSALVLEGSATVNQMSLFAANQTRICDWNTFFSVNASQLIDFPDAPAASAGPDPYFESKRYSFGDPMRLKRVKQILFTYASRDGTNSRMETIAGLSDASNPLSWTLLSTGLPQSASVPAVAPPYGVPGTARKKLMVSDRYMGFKLYSIRGASNPGLFSLRRLALGFQWKKVGK